MYYNCGMEDYKKIPDEQLVELVRTQNKELYKELVKRYEQKLMRYTTVYGKCQLYIPNRLHFIIWMKSRMKKSVRS